MPLPQANPANTWDSGVGYRRVLSPDGTQVTLTTGSAMSLGVVYTLSVNGVKTCSGTPLSPQELSRVAS